MLKKLTERLDERKQLVLTACVVGGLLVLAALIPLLFRTAPPERTDENLSSAMEHRTALFAAYWNEGDASGLDAETMIPDREMETFCENRMRTLVADSVIDEDFSYSVPTGREYTLVSDGSNSVRLCRMWLQSKGDWQNWVDACFDAETGRLYYLYVSRECLTNRSRYTGLGTGRDSAEAIAGLLAEDGGMTLRHFTGEKRSGTAVMDSPDGTVCYEIRCNWYDALIDVRIVCV